MEYFEIKNQTGTVLVQEPERKEIEWEGRGNGQTKGAVWLKGEKRRRERMESVGEGRSI